MTTRGTARRRRSLVATLATAGAFAIAAPPSASAQDVPEFVKGAAFASADGVEFVVITGGAQVGITLGRTISTYQDDFASAEARALDLGAFTSLFGELSRCDDRLPYLPAAALPPLTADDSALGVRQGDPIEVYFPIVGSATPSNRVAGTQWADATTGPSALARTTNPVQDMFFFRIDNPRTEATSRLDGHTRTAHATMTADRISILGGLIELLDPVWEATATSGDTEALTGGFSFRAATLFGFPREVTQAEGDLVALSRNIGSGLSALGVTLELPTSEIEGDRVRVSPLAFRLSDPPAGPASIRPFLDAAKPFLDILFADFVEADCQNTSVVQVVDVVLQVLKGSGSINIEVGGVEASTDDTYFPPAEIPDLGAGPSFDGDVSAGATFGDPGPISVIADGVTPPAPLDSGVGSIGTSGSVGGVAAGIGSIVAAPVEADSPPPTEAVDDSAEIAALLPSAVPISKETPGSTGGAATWIGIGLVAAALVMAVADRRMFHGATRRIIE